MIVRAPMIRTLLGRECLRLVKNPSAVILLGLLTAIALLIAVSRPQPRAPMTCWIVYWEDSSWIEHLRDRLPERPRIRVESQSRFRRVGEHLLYPPNSCAIELPPLEQDAAPGKASAVRIHYRYDGDDANVLMPFLQWFWPATAEHFGDLPQFVQDTSSIRPPSQPFPFASRELSGSFVSNLVTVEVSATLLLFIVQFFICCHMLVSFTSQDRERGTLTALALTPASIAELLIARFAFHLSLSLLVSAAIVSILHPASLAQPTLWASVVLTSLGLIAVGTTIATLSRTQTTAGLLTLSYMLGGSVVFYLATRFSAFGWLKLAMLERYSFPLTYISLKYPISLFAAPGLTALTLLTFLWIVVATSLFQKLGWRC